MKSPSPGMITVSTVHCALCENFDEKVIDDDENVVEMMAYLHSKGWRIGYVGDSEEMKNICPSCCKSL